MGLEFESPAGHQKERSELRFVLFLSKPQGLAYHHDGVVHIIAVGAYYHRRCIPLRFDEIQPCVLMICRNELRMIYNGKAVDFDRGIYSETEDMQALYMNSKLVSDNDYKCTDTNSALEISCCGSQGRLAVLGLAFRSSGRMRRRSRYYRSWRHRGFPFLPREGHSKKDHNLR